MYNKRNGQVSMEFMMLMGFVVFLSIPMFLFYQTYSNDAKYELSQNQARNIGTKIVDIAESVYYLGEPSQSTIKITMPDGIYDVVISPKEIDFQFNHKGNISNIWVESNVNLTGEISHTPGKKRILIKSIGDEVNISDI